MSFTEQILLEEKAEAKIAKVDEASLSAKYEGLIEELKQNHAIKISESELSDTLINNI